MLKKLSSYIKKKLYSIIISKQSNQANVINWTYDNQAAWKIEYGKHQSPVDIVTSDSIRGNTLQSIICDFIITPDYIIDRGRTIVVVAEGITSLINGREFKLMELHYHSLSDHTFDGEHTPIEAHYVYKGEDGRLAVIGVMMTEGAYNPEFDKILDNIVCQKQINLDIVIDNNKLLPDDKSYYHYIGSLTIPPLNENVEWYIFRNTVEVSYEQIDRFKAYYDNNYREIQRLNNRVITYFV